jgi:hypothetical protein
MKFLLLLLLAGCTTKEAEVEQVCEFSCTDCKNVELKCDTKIKREITEVGQ